MKKTSIRRKISLIVLGMAIVSLATFCAAAVWGLFSIRAQMQNSSAQLGEFATKNSSVFLEREAVSKLMAKAKDRSTIINERLRFIEKDAVYFSDYAGKIYKKSGELPPIPIPYPSSKNKEKLAMQLVSANGEADLPRIKKEAYLLGNISSAYISNSGDMDVMTVSLFLGTESGFMITYNPFSDDSNRVFDPRVRSWYIGAKEKGGLFWTDPYTDALSGKLIVTCSYPIYGVNGKFMGATGIDVVIDDLDKEIVNADMGEHSYAFIVDANGVLISSKELKKPVSGAYEKKSAYREGYPDYNSVIGKMAAGESGFGRVAAESGEKFIAFSPVSATGWGLAIEQPVSEIMGIVAENSAAIEKMTAETLGFVGGTIKAMFVVFVLIFALSAIAIIYFAEKMSGIITKPIVTLEGYFERIAGGELDTRIELRTGDEIERLGDSVNRMAQKLKSYIRNLQNITADKERFDAELDVARRIQASMLPRIFPPFPERVEFNIYASMQPAKEVGGDFYDFFFIDDNTLAVTIADVSGKGVPAALFMAIAKTLIKSGAQSGLSPKEVFETVNNLLCENNDTGMFVTAFMGYLDINSGKFTFVNAGHNPPMLQSNGRCDFIKVKPGFVIAGMEGTRFRQDEIVLQKGDILFLYTDGVTEAMNNDAAMFGEKRLIEAVNRHSGQSVMELATSVKLEIDMFADDAEQADDITMLALRYGSHNSEDRRQRGEGWRLGNDSDQGTDGSVGAATCRPPLKSAKTSTNCPPLTPAKTAINHPPYNMDDFSIDAKTENLDAVLDFITKKLRTANCPAKLQNQIAIAVEEAFVNISHYAYTPDTGAAIIRAAVLTGDEGEIIIEFEDTGKPYNPLEKEDPDITASAEDREIGGLGIFMVKNIMDSVDYRRDGDKNVLTLRKKLA